MKQLSKKELYLLLICSIDKHDLNDPVVKKNLLKFREELEEIRKISTNKIKCESLLELMKEVGNKIYTVKDEIVDIKGNSLPDPLTKQEIRNLKIDIIFADDN